MPEPVVVVPVVPVWGCDWYVPELVPVVVPEFVVVPLFIVPVPVVVPLFVVGG